MTKRLLVSDDIFDRLKVRAHYKQALAGVIMELLDMADKLEGKSIPPKPVTKERIVTVEDIQNMYKQVPPLPEQKPHVDTLPPYAPEDDNEGVEDELND